MSIKDQKILERYVRKKLFAIEQIAPYLCDSSVIETGSDFGLVWDFLIIMPKEKFQANFVHRFGHTFVLDDHEQCPPVFTRFKCYEWLNRDFERRLPIALWIFQNACIIQDPNNTFREIVDHYQGLFNQKIPEIIRAKYLELRSERHNLRQTVSLGHLTPVEIDLMRGTVVKLAFEILLLASRLPYPYKRCLAEEVRKKIGIEGQKLLTLADTFLRETCGPGIIAKSDDLITMVIRALTRRKLFEKAFLNRWWEYLD